VRVVEEIYYLEKVKAAEDKCTETGSCRGYHLGAIGEI
jgi:hypothetical protein